jgi:hypothetical protein
LLDGSVRQLNYDVDLEVLRTRVDGKDWLYLFYATQIGNGKNDGVYHYQYDRIRAMRRPIE